MSSSHPLITKNTCPKSLSLNSVLFYQESKVIVHDRTVTGFGQLLGAGQLSPGPEGRPRQPHSSRMDSTPNADGWLRSTRGSREMRTVADGSANVRKPVLHVSISWAPEDNPSRDQMEAVADDVLEEIRMKRYQAIFTAHGDEQYEHLHIMANRVHPITRRAVNLYNSWYDIQKTLRHAERRMGFREVPGHLYQLPDQVRPERSESLTKGAYKAAMGGRQVPFQMLVHRVAGNDFKQAHNWDDLTARLRRHGLALAARRTGVIVTDGHEYAKSSCVMRGLSGYSLAQRFNESYEAYLARRRRPVAALSQAIRETGLDHTALKSTEAGVSPLVQDFRRLQASGRSAELKDALGNDAYTALHHLSRHTAQGRTR